MNVAGTLRGSATVCHKDPARCAVIGQCKGRPFIPTVRKTKNNIATRGDTAKNPYLAAFLTSLVCFSDFPGLLF